MTESLQRKRPRGFMLTLLVIAVLTGVIVSSPLCAHGSTKEYKVGYVTRHLGDIFLGMVQKGFRDQMKMFEKTKGVKVDIIMKGSDVPSEQLSFTETLAIRPVDIAVVFAMDSSLTQMVTNFTMENIPVIAHNSSIYNSHCVLVSFGNFEAANVAGKSLIRALTDKYGPDPKEWAKAGGIIVQLAGKIGMDIVTQRTNGFNAAMKPYVEKVEGLEIITRPTGWRPEVAYEELERLITKYGDRIIGVFAQGDREATIGTWPVLEANGMGYLKGHPKHIPIVTIDGTPECLKQIREGKIDAVAIQPGYGEGRVCGLLAERILTMGYDKALAKPGETLYEDAKPLPVILYPEDYGSEYAAVKAFWSPVKVFRGETWDGLWYKLSAKSCPDDIPATSKLLWGNFVPFSETGEWPEGVK